LLRGADVLQYMPADVHAVVDLVRDWVVKDVEAAASGSVPGAGGV